MARQTVPHSSNFSFPVTLEPLTIDGHDSGFFGTVRRDEGFPRVLGVAGERYGLLQNSDFINQIEEGFKKANLSGFEREVAVMDHGARCQAQWTFKNRTIKVRKVGDEMAFRVTARNSYDGSWKVSMDDRHIPKLKLASAYKDMLAGQALGEKERTYILERMRQGKFLIGAIEERQRTVERLAHIIVERQGDFFEHGPSQLRPLTMTDVAKEMGVHETTVGRAAANKWMLTPHGLKEFRWFFTSGVATEDGGTVAQEGVQEIIADILARENPAAPLADEAITAELRKRGIQIARRTVAKYREALGQPSAHMRRRRL